MSERAYPLSRRVEDERFTFGLIADVAAVLQAAGYPEITGVDAVELRQALFTFLYGSAS